VAPFNRTPQCAIPEHRRASKYRIRPRFKKQGLVKGALNCGGLLSYSPSADATHGMAPRTARPTSTLPQRGHKKNRSH
jgi:hypothetical protein